MFVDQKTAAHDEQRMRTAKEAGWHESRYNLYASVPGTNVVAVVNLYKRAYVELTPLESYLLSIFGELEEDHPIIARFAKQGILANFDERAALEAKGRCECTMPSGSVWLTICPTMACNFDCPYCFEANRRGKMSSAVQDDVVALAGRMLDASRAKKLNITWYGGEPLLALDVIEALSERLMAIANERGASYDAQIVTNGYLITQTAANRLWQCRVTQAQVTIDGIGAVHDATRHLAGGGATFDRIVANLRDQKLPFSVYVRANVHEGNISQIDDLKELVNEISKESGNNISFYAKPVLPSVAAEERCRQVELLSGADAVDIGLREGKRRIPVGDDHRCAAITLWSVLVDVRGNLHRCAGLTADDPRFAYGNVRDWDPADPLATASSPDNFSMYLNCASPVPDEECRECVWLPLCGGGCPHYRLLGKKLCLPYRDYPERYVLAQHARIAKQRQRSQG